MWGLSSLTRDQTRSPAQEVASGPLDGQEYQDGGAGGSASFFCKGLG